MRHTVDVVRVRQLLAQGCTPAQVAMRINVSKSVVLRIAKDKYQGGGR